MQSIAEQPLGRLADAIASIEPAPGSGAAAAAALTLGIACARKAAAITLRHRPDAAGLEQEDARLAELSGRALRLGDTDASCFGALIGHDEAAADALAKAGEQLLHLAAEALDRVASIAASSDPKMRNDVLAAQQLIDAAIRIVRANLEDNQPLVASRSDVVR